MRTTAVIAATLVLAGCATNAHYVNSDAGRSNQYYFDMDKYQCERENTYYMFAFGTLAPNVNDYAAGQCMRARGWRET